MPAVHDNNKFFNYLSDLISNEIRERYGESILINLEVQYLPQDVIESFATKTTDYRVDLNNGCHITLRSVDEPLPF